MKISLATLQKLIDEAELDIKFDCESGLFVDGGKNYHAGQSLMSLLFSKQVEKRNEEGKDDEEHISGDA